MSALTLSQTIFGNNGLLHHLEQSPDAFVAKVASQTRALNSVNQRILSQSTTDQNSPKERQRLVYFMESQLTPMLDCQEFIGLMKKGASADELMNYLNQQTSPRPSPSSTRK